ncbi:MAG: SHOCT domain-containing protein [Solirubrobacteraceae bacterium]
MSGGRLQPGTRAIVGIGIALFFAVLLGAGLHHLIRTGTCSSSGYNEYGPTQVCPAGTGAWIGMLMGGIFGVLIGLAVAGAFAFIVPLMFMAIGAGSISVAFDKSAASGASTFGIIFGGCFFLAGLIPFLFMLRGVLSGGARRSPLGALSGAGGVSAAGGLGFSALRSARAAQAAGASVSPSASPTATASPVLSDAAAAFGDGPSKRDAIMDAYASGASGGASGSSGGASGSGLGSGFGSGFGSGSTPSSGLSGAGGPKRDPYEQIGRLADLRKSGALTDEEFQREKAKLLNEI